MPKNNTRDQHKHHHRGKSSESLLDNAQILANLFITPGQVILDAGCGNGYMAKEFAAIIKDAGKVYALDPDAEAIDILQSETKGMNIETLVSDISLDTELEAHSVDLLYLSMVFHGFSKAQRAGFVIEAKRLLKPGGKLAIVEFAKKQTPFGPPLEIRLSPEELRKIVAFSPIKLLEIGEYFYMQVFENLLA